MTKCVTNNLACVVGARPNFVKMAPVLRELDKARIPATLIHTGQHYDHAMSSVFFKDLGIREPDINLEVGSSSHAVQTARIVERFEQVLISGAPDGRPYTRLLVVGDVNSTMACTLVAAKLQIPVAHVEAGLRSFDRSMPEEINRLVTDSLADCLLVSEPSGVTNLRREGHPDEQIHLVGNVMVDTLLACLDDARQTGVLGRLGLEPRQYGVVTLHRPANVDCQETLTSLVETLIELSRELTLVFPIHPRTEAQLSRAGLLERLRDCRTIVQTPSLGYLEFLGLTSSARLVITDSGGLQEESTALGIPCLTCRPNTERPITVEQGTSTLVGSDAGAVRKHFGQILNGSYKSGECPALWDGRAAERMVEILSKL